MALADGVHSRAFSGCGAIVVHDPGAGLGLVVVDRNTVAVGPGDILLSFGAAPAEISGLCRFLHPLHNFAIVSYDPGALPPEASAAVRPIALAPPGAGALRRGASVQLFALSSALRILRRDSTVTHADVAVSIRRPAVPRFRCAGAAQKRRGAARRGAALLDGFYGGER